MSQILVVDDEPAICWAIQQALGDGGHSVAIAGSGEAACEQIAAGYRPELVVLDVRLPGLDGLALMDRLAPTLAGVPVVVMTAHGSVTLAVEAMQAGASDFLVKPFAPERLTVTVANVMERAELRRQVAVLAAGAPRQGFAGFIGAAFTTCALKLMHL